MTDVTGRANPEFHLDNVQETRPGFHSDIVRVTSDTGKSLLSDSNNLSHLLYKISFTINMSLTGGQCLTADDGLFFEQRPVRRTKDELLQGSAAEQRSRRETLC